MKLIKLNIWNNKVTIISVTYFNNYNNLREKENIWNEIEKKYLYNEKTDKIKIKLRKKNTQKLKHWKK